MRFVIIGDGEDGSHLTSGLHNITRCGCRFDPDDATRVDYNPADGSEQPHPTVCMDCAILGPLSNRHEKDLRLLGELRTTRRTDIRQMDDDEIVEGIREQFRYLRVDASDLFDARINSHVDEHIEEIRDRLQTVSLHLSEVAKRKGGSA